MAASQIRVGIVGAGQNTRLRHIPGFRAIDGVEILGVVNSTPDSTDRAAKQLEIPRTYPHWQALVEDADIDAVMIGAWPNLHCEVTCAALDAGKHVLTEARMARDAAEAQRMLHAAEEHSHLIKQIVPSPFGLAQNEYVRELIDEGFLGDLRELVVIAADDGFWDANQPLHPRQDAELSGMNILAMGILHETALRFSPAPTRVFAQTTLFQGERPLPDGSASVQATVPDSVQILTQLEGGGRGLYHLSGIDLFGPGMQIHLYGCRGTIKFLFKPEERLLIGRAGDAELKEVEIPAEKLGGWRVEEEFIGAIRGDENVCLTNFATGVKYMEFTEAVQRSAAANQPVDLPFSGGRNETEVKGCTSNTRTN